MINIIKKYASEIAIVVLFLGVLVFLAIALAITWQTKLAEAGGADYETMYMELKEDYEDLQEDYDDRGVELESKHLDLIQCQRVINDQNPWEFMGLEMGESMEGEEIKVEIVEGQVIKGKIIKQ